MIHFNLEAALRGSPVVTRDGHPVIQLTYFKDCTESYCLCAVVNDRLESFTREGRYLREGDSYYDLFMASIEHTN